MAHYQLMPAAIHDVDEEMGDTGDTSIAPPSFCGLPLKHLSLITLAIQNSMLTLIMHHSRISTPPSHTYSAATAVLMNELFKGLVSFAIAYLRTEISSDASQTAGLSWRAHVRISTPRLQKLTKEVFSPDCWKLSVPAILYVIQNNLQYVAASNLDAATFQVTYQMKIITTAAFSVLLLRRKLSLSQWLALFCLAAGVSIVQIQSPSTPGVPTSLAPSADIHTMNALKGFLAVSSACFTSGLAGVYFEMVLKNSQADLWVRNVQLSLFSFLPALAPIFFSHRLLETGGLFSTLFRNFGLWAWATVGVQVFGGLITAMVIKHSGNILKGFATSLSIVLSFLASIALFDFHLSFTFMLGSVIVLVATWLYNQPSKRVGFLARDTFLWSVTLRSEKKNGATGSHLQRLPTFHAGRTMSASLSTSPLSPLPLVVSL